MPAQQPGGNNGFNFQSFLSSVTAKTTSSSAKSTSSAAQTTSTDPATSTDADSDTISTSIALGVSTTATLNEPVATTSSDAATITSDSATEASSLDSAVLSTSTASSDEQTSAAGIAATPTSTALSSFETATSAQSTTNPAASSAYPAFNSALPETVAAHHNSGLSGGALAAAILVPVLLALFALLLAFLCIRRRRKQNPDDAAPAFLPTMQEKLGFRSHVTPPTPTAPTAFAAGAVVAPVLTSHRNNAYYTGLDTSSHGSERGHSGEYYAPVRRSDGGTFAEPPPPYKTKSLGTNSARDSVQSAINGVGKPQNTSGPISSTPPRLPPIAITSAGYPLLRPSSPPPAGNGRPDSDTFPSTAAVLSPFEDPPSPTTSARSHDTVTPASALLSPNNAATTAVAGGAAAAAAAARPGTSRSTTGTAESEPYRDEEAAEVHVGQAQAVRMSVLQPTVRRYSGGTMLSDVSGREAFNRGANGRPVSDPFADGDGASMTDGGRVSPVSSLGSENSHEVEKWNGWRISR